MFRLLTILAAIAAVAVSAAPASAGSSKQPPPRGTLGYTRSSEEPTESFSFLKAGPPKPRGTQSGGEVISDFVKAPPSLNTFGGNDT